MIRKIQDIFKKNENRIFIIEDSYGCSTITYGDFYRLIGHSVSLLEQFNVRKGDIVAAVLTNSTEFAALYFACIYKGCVILPINLNIHADEIKHILNSNTIKLLVYSLCTRSVVMNVSSSINCKSIMILMRHEEFNHPEEDDHVSLLDLEPVALHDRNSDNSMFSITFTSGTTSMPKRIIHSIENWFGNAESFNKAMGFGRENRFLHIWPMAYSTGFLNTLVSPFLAEGSVVLRPIFDSNTIIDFWSPVLRHQINTFWLAPSMLSALNRVDKDPKGIDYCKNQKVTFCVGTAPLPVKVRNEFQNKYGVRIFESYGLSELLLISSEIPSKEDNPSVGKLLPCVEIKVKNKKADASNGEGEIFVKTPWQCLGYMNDSLRDEIDYFDTGDMGYLDENENLHISGRTKDIIIRGGLNISPKSIEEVILQHSKVEEVAVFGIQHEFYGEKIIAAVKLLPGYRIEEESSSILELCRKKLNTYSVPTSIIQVNDFPRNSSGKIKKSKLRDEYLKT